jgi:hypothetical protein
LHRSGVFRKPRVAFLDWSPLLKSSRGKRKPYQSVDEKKYVIRRKTLTTKGAKDTKKEKIFEI